MSNEIRAEKGDERGLLYIQQEFRLSRVFVNQIIFQENIQYGVLRKSKHTANACIYKLLLIQHTSNTTKVAWVTLFVFQNEQYDEDGLLSLACQGVIDDIDNNYVASKAYSIGSDELRLNSRFYCCKTLSSKNELCHIHETYPAFAVTYIDRCKFLLDNL